MLRPRLRMFFVALVWLAGLASSCRPAAAPLPRTIAVARPTGSWQGSGGSTIGFVSDSGHFRVTWHTRNEQPAGHGYFRLTVHSAVSGRAMEVLVDRRGEGQGIQEFADQPRSYNLMVDSAHVEWSVSVDEFVTVVTP